MVYEKTELKRAFDYLMIVNDDLLSYAVKLDKYETDSARLLHDTVLEAKGLITSVIEKLGEANSIKLKRSIQ